MKPHLKMVSGEIVSVTRPLSRIEVARARFGQPFAHEPGAKWKPRPVPVLTEWMQSRGKQ